jgi:hypothetical protein
MTIRIRNWERFQHYKNRRPPWIKLYRGLLDDPDFHELSGDACKILVMCWLIASEDDELAGNLPSIRTLAFRMRLRKERLLKYLNELSSWIEVDDSNSLAGCAQHDTPETETEGETEIRDRDQRESKNDHFPQFWAAYPRKVGKAAAEKAWGRLAPPLDAVLSAIEEYKESGQWRDKQFIPHPATWINQGRWEDEIEKVEPSAPQTKYTATEQASMRAQAVLDKYLGDESGE